MGDTSVDQPKPKAIHEMSKKERSEFLKKRTKEVNFMKKQRSLEHEMDNAPDKLLVGLKDKMHMVGYIGYAGMIDRFREARKK
jgi:hypothetical protein